MNNKEIKDWVKDAIQKGFDRDDVEEIIENESKINNEDKQRILSVYDEEIVGTEKLKLGFFQRRRLKKFLKKVEKKIKDDAKIIKKLTSNIKALDKVERLKLKKLENQMLDAIFGDVKKGTQGLAELFEVTDESGKVLTREMVETFKLEEKEDLLEDLLDALKKEI